jgi:hypothetical protein
LKQAGVSQPTIHFGLQELKNKKEKEVNFDRIRRTFGGRKKITEVDPNARNELESLLKPSSRKDPESPLRWTCKSVRNLSKELHTRGYPLSFRTVCYWLEKLGYSLLANKRRSKSSQ